jgi:hypothetical protein
VVAIVGLAFLTVRATLAELTLCEGEPLSLNLSSKDHEPAVDRTPVDAVGLSPALQEKEPPKLL